jgi:hypothetical protein
MISDKTRLMVENRQGLEAKRGAEGVGSCIASLARLSPGAAHYEVPSINNQ